MLMQINSSTQISGNPTEFFGILVFPAVEKFYLFPKSGFCGKSGHIPVPIPGISALKKNELKSSHLQNCMPSWHGTLSVRGEKSSREDSRIIILGFLNL